VRADGHDEGLHLLLDEGAGAVGCDVRWAVAFPLVFIPETQPLPSPRTILTLLLRERMTLMLPLSNGLRVIIEHPRRRSILQL
jgi:hypothetical protein